MRGTTLCGILSILGQVMSQQASYQPGTGGGFPGSGGGRIGGGGGGIGGGGAGGEGSLEETIPGIPGEDYPIYSEVPETSFFCDGQVDGGYYGDPEAECQAFHICASDGNGGLTKYSFLCPNGTLFNQRYFVCDWWFNVDCSQAEQLYSINEDIAREREQFSRGGSQGSGSGGRRSNGQQFSSGGGSSSGFSRGFSNQGSSSSGFSRGFSSQTSNSYGSPLSGYTRRARKASDKPASAARNNAEQAVTDREQPSPAIRKAPQHAEAGQHSSKSVRKTAEH